MGVAAVVAPVKSWMVAANVSRENTSATRLLRRVFDFGNNYAGVTEVAVTGGAPGAVLTMTHTETADDNDGHTGPVDNLFYIENGKNCFDRVLVDGNCANQTDQLILGRGRSTVTSQAIKKSAIALSFLSLIVCDSRGRHSESTRRPVRVTVRMGRWFPMSGRHSSPTTGFVTCNSR